MQFVVCLEQWPIASLWHIIHHYVLTLSAVLNPLGRVVGDSVFEYNV